MRLNPKEQEKLMLHMAGELAKQRKERGLRLNYVVPNCWNAPVTGKRWWS